MSVVSWRFGWVPTQNDLLQKFETDTHNKSEPTKFAQLQETPKQSKVRTSRPFSFVFCSCPYFSPLFFHLLCVNSLKTAAITKQAVFGQEGKPYVTRTRAMKEFIFFRLFRRYMRKRKVIVRR